MTPTREICHTLTRTRFGWSCMTTHGTGKLENGPRALTERGIRKKADRLTRRLQGADKRRDQAIHLVPGPNPLPEDRSQTEDTRSSMTMREGFGAR